MKLGELSFDILVNQGQAIDDLTNFGLRLMSLEKVAKTIGSVFGVVLGGVGENVEMLNKTITSSLNLMELQDLRIWADQIGISTDTLVNEADKLQQAIVKFQKMQNTDTAQKLQELLGVPIFNKDYMSQFSGAEAFFKHILDLVNQVQATEGGASAEQNKQWLIRELQLNKDILVAAERKAKEIDRSLYTTEEELKASADLYQNWVVLRQIVKTDFKKSLQEAVPLMNSLVIKAIELYNAFRQWKEEQGGFFKGVANFLLRRHPEDEVPEGYIRVPKNIDKLMGWEEDENYQNPYADEDLKYLENKPDEETIKYNKSRLMQPIFNEPFKYSSGGVSFSDNSTVNIYTSDGANSYKNIADNQTSNFKKMINDMNGAQLYMARG